MIHWMESQGAWAPWLFVALFVAASLLMIWRLEAVSAGGLEGTVIGTLITPYCSGMGNLLFVFIVARGSGSAEEVITNSLVNNVTNMTLLIGLPTIIWGMNLLPAAKAKRKNRGKVRAQEINRLTLLLTLSAVLFFTGAVWALGLDGRIDFSDGLVLVGLFLFWQCFHVFEVLKSNVRQNRSLGALLWVDLALLGVGAYAQYLSIDWLVNWISQDRSGFISAGNLGWLSGWLMVLPNGLLALYYGWRASPEVVYTSQVGDGHICIPLCLGLFALLHPFAVPPMFGHGLILLLAVSVGHFLMLAIFGQLPRFLGWVLLGIYGVFLYLGLSGRS